jgi:hypothetical protein
METEQFSTIRQRIVGVFSSMEKLFLIYDTLNYDKSGLEKLFANPVPIGDAAVDLIAGSVEFVAEVDGMASFGSLVELTFRFEEGYQVPMQ